MGDNPSCSRGPPLAIGWNYDPSNVVNLSVDTFESQPSRRDGRQTNKYELLMDRYEREQTLLDLGYTKSEIAVATRQTLEDKRRRRQTVDNLVMSYVEEKVEGFKKSIRRHLLKKKSTKKMYKDWKKAVEINKPTSYSLSAWHQARLILVLSREDSESTPSLMESTEEMSVMDGCVDDQLCVPM